MLATTLQAFFEYAACLYFFVLHTLFALTARLTKRTIVPKVGESRDFQLVKTIFKLADDEFSMLLQISAREAANMIRAREASLTAKALFFVGWRRRAIVHFRSALNNLSKRMYDERHM